MTRLLVERHELEFDVVIIGSGAGGAPIAHDSSGPASRVLMLEKGPLLRTAARERARPAERLQARRAVATPAPRSGSHRARDGEPGGSFYASHVEPDLNDEPHIYRNPDGRRLARRSRATPRRSSAAARSSTAASRCASRPPTCGWPASTPAARTCARIHNGEVEREARDWPIRYDELEPYYAQGRAAGRHQRHAREPGQAVQRRPLPDRRSRPTRSASSRGPAWNALGMKRYRTPLAVITEDHAPSGRTAPADPEDRATSTATAIRSATSRTPGCRCCGRRAAIRRHLRAAAELRRHAPRERRRTRHKRALPRPERPSGTRHRPRSSSSPARRSRPVRLLHAVGRGGPPALVRARIKPERACSASIS